MSPQEFLDRESWWNMSFFLAEDGRWAYVEITIRDWTVRLNNIRM